MTAYWPTSAVMQHLDPMQKHHVENAIQGIPQRTMLACHNVTSKLPADTTLTLIYSEGVASRRVYLQYPTCEQWVALERSGFVEASDTFGFILDALH